MAALSLVVSLVSLVGCGSNETVSSQISSEAPIISESSSLSQEVEQENWWDSAIMPLPLTQNSLTGLPLAEDYQQGQRPVAIMVANDAKALPQRGLAQADLMYEMLIEGGATRLMAVYSDYRTIPEVGPVRSSQDQFIQMAIPQNFILQYIDSTVYGNNLLLVENYKTIDGINLGEIAFKFDNDRFSSRYKHRSAEYCWFTDAGLLWNGMEQQDIYTSAEEKSVFRFSQVPAQVGTDAYYIEVFYSPISKASFNYDEAAGIYNKNIFDAPHTDEDGNILSYTNVFLLETQVGVKEDGQLPNYDFSSGEGYYFTAGKVQKIQWHKGGPSEQLKFADIEGNMLEVQLGKSYVGFVPKNEGASISYIAKPEEVQIEAPVEAPVEEIPATTEEVVPNQEEVQQVG